jgi:hypothetical protein
LAGCFESNAADRRCSRRGNSRGKSAGTYGGNTFMVTNQSKFFYIDVSPLNAHPAVIVGQRQQ